MKFFFPELGSCFGGAAIAPAAQTVAASSTELPSTRRRRIEKVQSAKHWRPGLSAIAEDGAIFEVRKESTQPAVVRSEKKPINRSKSTGNSRSPSGYGDYRASAHPMAIPAFSPTPFLF